MQTELKIITTSWHENQQLLSSLRNKVFVQEQGVPEALELDEHDESAWHFLAYTEPGHEAIGTARLLQDGHIGRMAVLKAYRGQQVGARLLSQVIEYARKQQMTRVFLHAQLSAIGFYEKAGFITQGEIFLDAGIEHLLMTLALGQSQSN